MAKKISCKCKTGLIAVVLLVLTACSSDDAANSNSISETVASKQKNPATKLFGEAAMTAGTVEFPAIPPIVVPEFVGVGPAQQNLESSMKDFIDPIAGISIKPARCGEDDALINDAGLTSINAQGNLTRVDKHGVFEIAADGTGSAVIEGGVFEVAADGSGSVVRGEEVIEVDGTGAGTYVGRYGVIELDGRGKGSFVARSGGKGVIEINGDGSGSWTGPIGVIEINTNGSGSWVGGPLGIVENRGDGTGTVAGVETKMAPIPKVRPAGGFPPMDRFVPPAAPCGFVISLNDRILFDFDKSELRPEASEVLDTLANALKDVQATSVEIRGHTDARGSDDYNQTLSEKRARSVLAGLQQRSAAQSATSTGYGESLPVAPNEFNNQDDPSGRQRNRRVEIFVRT